MRISEKSRSIEIKFKPFAGKKVFSVRFPNKTLAAFRKLAPKTKAGIVESVGRCYKALNSELEEAKAVPLVNFVEAKKQFSPPNDFASGNLLEKWGNYEAATHDRDVKAKVLRLLRYAHFRQLSGEVAPMLRLAVQQAIDDDDCGFFKKLGRLLEKQPVILDPPKEPTPAENLLLEHWICQKEKAVHLCCFTDAAIDDFLRAVGVGQSFNSVRKTRQLLDLQRLPAKFPFIKCVKHEGDTIALG